MFHVPVLNLKCFGEVDFSNVTNLAELGALLIGATGTGTVTSVGLTLPGGLDVANSPVTGSGTITVTTSLSGLVKASGGAFVNATAGTDYLTASSTSTLTNKTLSTGCVIATGTSFTGAAMNLGSDATGDIYYRNNSGNLVRLGIGTSGQTLGVNSGVPQWQSVSQVANFTSGAIDNVTIGANFPVTAGFTQVLVRDPASANNTTIQVVGGTVLVLKNSSLVTKISFRNSSNSEKFAIDYGNSLVSSTLAFQTLSINGLTITNNGSNTLNITAGKTVEVQNSVIFQAVDSSTVSFGSGGSVAYTNLSQTFTSPEGFSNSFSLVPDSITGSGAIPLNRPSLAIDTTGGAIALTLADGFNGQVLILALLADGGDAVITPANLLGATTITMNDVKDAVVLQFMFATWVIISNIGCTVA